MIFDELTNAASYSNLHPRIACGLAFLQGLAGGDFTERRESLDGDNLFALFQQYATKAPEEGFWESHRRYADIQYIVSGVERMDVLPLSALGQPSKWDEERDFCVYPNPAPAADAAVPVSLVVRAGSFAIFLPQDAHMPNLSATAEGGQVQKIVLKVLL